MDKLIKYVLFIFISLVFIACSSTQPQYVDSRDYVSFGLDSHDIGDMLEKLIELLLDNPTIRKQNEPKIIVIGEIANDTGQRSIDTEIIANEIINYLSKSGKFAIVNAGQNAKIEQIIRQSRKFRNDKEYNQYTTIEQGNLISPHYALTGKIIERNKASGDDKIKEYAFSLTLTDLKTGAILWGNTARINKKLPKEEVAKSSYNSSSYSYNQSYSYSNNDDSDSWESVKEFFSFGADGRNHFTLGVDFGLGGSSINLKPIDFTIIEKGYYSATTTTQHSMWLDDTYNSSKFAMPINIRLGYLRDIGDNWAFALNFLYSYLYLESIGSSYELETTADTIEVESDSKKLTHSFQRIGGEFVLYYKALDWLHIYAGGGVLKDFGSKYKVSFEAYRGYYSDISINEKGQKRFELEQKIDSWYPLVKFGILWNFHNYIGATTDLTCSWALKEENYLGLNCGLVLGLQFKI